MWKCPSCGTVNRTAQCTACGFSKKQTSAYRPSFSALRFFVLAALSLVLIFIIFKVTDYIIDQRARENAERLNAEYSFEDYLDKTPEEQDAIRNAK